MAVAAQQEQSIETDGAEDPVVTSHTCLESFLQASPHGPTARAVGTHSLCSRSVFSSFAQAKRDPG